jgi:hypothetical protein
MLCCALTALPPDDSRAQGTMCESWKLKRIHEWSTWPCSKGDDENRASRSESVKQAVSGKLAIWHLGLMWAPQILRL